MASHHFIGTGPYSSDLRGLAEDAPRLLERGEEMIATAGFQVVERSSARFPGGGLTAVWILAESHLVLHFWAEEGFATIDLHICDYGGSNRAKAEALVARLTESWFEPGRSSWRELSLEPPRRRRDLVKNPG